MGTGSSPHLRIGPRDRDTPTPLMCKHPWRHEILCEPKVTGSGPSGWRDPGPAAHNAPMADNRILYRDSRRAAGWGIAVSLGLGLVKALAGLWGGSLALLSDAVHS